MRSNYSSNGSSPELALLRQFRRSFSERDWCRHPLACLGDTAEDLLRFLSPLGLRKSVAEHGQRVMTRSQRITAVLLHIEGDIDVHVVPGRSIVNKVRWSRVYGDIALMSGRSSIVTITVLSPTATFLEIPIDRLLGGLANHPGLLLKFGHEVALAAHYLGRQLCRCVLPPEDLIYEKIYRENGGDLLFTYRDYHELIDKRGSLNTAKSVYCREVVPRLLSKYPEIERVRDRPTTFRLNLDALQKGL